MGILEQLCGTYKSIWPEKDELRVVGSLCSSDNFFPSCCFVWLAVYHAHSDERNKHHEMWCRYKAWLLMLLEKCAKLLQRVLGEPINQTYGRPMNKAVSFNLKLLSCMFCIKNTLKMHSWMSSLAQFPNELWFKTESRALPALLCYSNEVPGELFSRELLEN